MKWLEIAWEQEGAGVDEIGGPAANTSIVAYFHDINRPDITSDEVPWCAAFYFWCLWKSGADLSSIPAAERLLAYSATKFGTRISAPRVGCGCIMKRPGGHHVFFVTKWTATTITGVGGNQANKVCETTFKRTPDMIFMWPEVVTQKQTDRASEIAGTAKAIQADTAKTGLSNTVNQVLPALPEKLPAPDALATSARSLKSTLETGFDFMTFGYSKLWFVVAALSVYWVLRIAWNSNWIRKWRHEDAATGVQPLPSTPAAAEPEGVF